MTEFIKWKIVHLDQTQEVTNNGKNLTNIHIKKSKEGNISSNTEESQILNIAFGRDIYIFLHSQSKIN
jgi:hypothetical protein